MVQRRPRAPPRCHKEGHTGRARERGDSSATAPGPSTVSQGRAHRAGTGGASVAVGGVGGRLQAVRPLEPRLRASSGGPEWQEGPSSQSCCAVRRRRRTQSSAVLSSSRRNKVPGSFFISSFIYLFILAASCGFGSSGPQSGSEPGPSAPRVQGPTLGTTSEVPDAVFSRTYPARVGSGDNVCPACQTRTAFISPLFLLYRLQHVLFYNESQENSITSRWVTLMSAETPLLRQDPTAATLLKEMPCPLPPASEEPEPVPRSRHDALVSAAALQRHPDITTNIHLVFFPVLAQSPENLGFPEWRVRGASFVHNKPLQPHLGSHQSGDSQRTGAGCQGTLHPTPDL